MANQFFNYLLESSLCLTVFMIVYTTFIRNCTSFSWIRFYLLGSMALSLILPFINIPVQWSASLIPIEPFPTGSLIHTKHTAGNAINPVPNPDQNISETSVLQLLLYTALIVYIVGFIYRTYLITKNILIINALVKKSEKEREGNIWIISRHQEVPAFSFFNYIFINSTYKNFTAHELEIIKQHEKVHANQYHTMDILFLEFYSIVFWFNPFVSYLRKILKQIHEFIADEIVAGEGEHKKKIRTLITEISIRPQRIWSDHKLCRGTCEAKNSNDRTAADIPYI